MKNEIASFRKIALSNVFFHFEWHDFKYLNVSSYSAHIHRNVSFVMDTNVQNTTITLYFATKGCVTDMLKSKDLSWTTYFILHTKFSKTSFKKICFKLSINTIFKIYQIVMWNYSAITL